MRAVSMILGVLVQFGTTIQAFHFAPGTLMLAQQWETSLHLQCQGFIQSSNSIPESGGASKFCLVRHQDLEEELSNNHLMQDYMETTIATMSFTCTFMVRWMNGSMSISKGRCFFFYLQTFGAWVLIVFALILNREIGRTDYDNHFLVFNGAVIHLNDNIGNMFPSIEDLFGANFTLIHFPPELHLVLEFEEGKREITTMQPETRVCDLIERIADVRDGIEPSDLSISYHGKYLKDTDTMFKVFEEQ